MLRDPAPVRLPRSRLRLLLALVLVAGVLGAAGADAATSCRRWIGPSGSDANPGTSARPWRTLTHAAEAVPDDRCTVWVRDGVYREAIEIERRFSSMTTFAAINPYMATLENDDIVLDIDGASRVTLEGFEFRHSDPSASNHVIIIDRKDDVWASHIVLRNNIIHDSYDNDLLKIHNGAHFVTVAGNLFFNQGPSEQHIDVNSVRDVWIEDNVFYNDLGGAGRSPDETKHFIVVKDSNGADDGQLGAERITIQRNVFVNWEGGNEAFISLGNDGKSYYEARSVEIHNNLLLGNSDVPAATTVAVNGARDVIVANNTTTGDFPSQAYGMILRTKGSNPTNRNIVFANNIWSDPTRSMDDFSDGEDDATVGLELTSNLFWNGGARLPTGSPASPFDDEDRVVANPQLDSELGALVPPRWRDGRFANGNTTIRQEFLRLVDRYGTIPATSPALDRGNDAYAPADDIYGLPRTGATTIGAHDPFDPVAACAELPATMTGTSGDDTLTGTAGDDVIKGFGGNDTIRGGGGNDVICGGTGGDALYGGTGHDIVLGGGGADTLRGGSGNDVVHSGLGNDVVFGGAGHDVLVGNAGNDRLVGGAGDDVVRGGANADTLSGGAGSDWLRGDAGRDEVTGNAGSDRVSGGGGHDATVAGGDGPDLVLGGPGDDRVLGGKGPDTLNGGPGSDMLFGGSGSDVCWLGELLFSCEQGSPARWPSLFLMPALAVSLPVVRHRSPRAGKQALR